MRPEQTCRCCPKSGVHINLLGTETSQVVVAYTVSGGGDKPETAIKLTDSYHRDFQRLDAGLVGRAMPEIAPYYRLDNLPLQVAWFDPTKQRITPEWPQYFDITLDLPEGRANLRVSAFGFGGPVLPVGEPYEELALLHPELAVGFARDRARFFTDGRWKADKPLVRAWKDGGYDPLVSAVDWYKMTIHLADRLARQLGTPPPSHTDDLREMADVLQRLDRTREAAQARQKAGQE